MAPIILNGMLQYIQQLKEVCESPNCKQPTTEQVQRATIHRKKGTFFSPTFPSSLFFHSLVPTNQMVLQ